MGSHPDLWSFVDILKTTQNSRDLGVEHLLAVIQQNPKIIRLQHADERLFHFVSNFNENDNLLKFLRGIQYNFSIN